MKHFSKVLSKVDWKLLAEQRQELAVLIEDLRHELTKGSIGDADYLAQVGDQLEAVEGVLNFLDDLSDAAEAEGVFIFEEEEYNGN